MRRCAGWPGRMHASVFTAWKWSGLPNAHMATWLAWWCMRGKVGCTTPTPWDGSTYQSINWGHGLQSGRRAGGRGDFVSNADD